MATLYVLGFIVTLFLVGSRAAPNEDGPTRLVLASGIAAVWPVLAFVWVARRVVK